MILRVKEKYQKILPMPVAAARISTVIKRSFACRTACSFTLSGDGFLIFTVNSPFWMVSYHILGDLTSAGSLHAAQIVRGERCARTNRIGQQQEQEKILRLKTVKSAVLFSNEPLSLQTIRYESTGSGPCPRPAPAMCRHRAEPYPSQCLHQRFHCA